MTELINALDRILNWLGEHQPTAAAGFQPGLPADVIAEKLNRLPFQVSQEVYELYQWRNGDKTYSSVFGYLSFLDLNSACEFSDNINDDALLKIRQQDEEPSYLFPLFDFEGEYFAVQGTEEPIATAPIFHISDDYSVSLAFVSLTNMMLAIAECYKTGVYTVNDGGNIDVIDEVKFGEIRQRYNPGTVKSLYVGGW